MNDTRSHRRRRGAHGAHVAQELARRDYANVVLVDIVENLPQGIALDLDQAASVLGYEPTVTGSNSYEDTAGSDVVVVTAGVPRKPGMSRDDLVTTNEKIVGSVTGAGARALAGHDRHRRSRIRSMRCATSRRAPPGFPRSG